MQQCAMHFLQKTKEEFIMFNKMSRRSFIKGAAASAMGIAALGLVQPVATA